MVEWLTTLLCIREVPGSNLGEETDYPDSSWFSSVLPEECRDSALKLGHDRFLPNPFQFFIHLSPYQSTLYSRMLGLHGDSLDIRVENRVKIIAKCLCVNRLYSSVAGIL
jgi:hypothetical protein